jgi:hypothetical protein
VSAYPWRHESEGWADLLEKLELPANVTDVLPAVCDRFLEAKHFLTLSAELPVERVNVERANWYVGAHLSAVISIEDAAAVDNRRRGRSDQDSVLRREFFLRTDDALAGKRDPVGINRAYRELRNLRIHHGEPVVEMAARALLLDLPSQAQNLRPRWYLRPLAGASVTGLNLHATKSGRRPLLSAEERERFNDFIHSRPFTRVATQHLYILGRAILDDAR